MNMLELHVYAYDGDEEQLTEYLKRGYDVNLRDEDTGGRTALHWSVTRQHMECTRLLLLNGADPNVAMYSGFTALHTAAQVGNPLIMKMLLDAGADVMRADKSGDIPLNIAKRYGSEECEDMLIA